MIPFAFAIFDVDDVLVSMDALSRRGQEAALTALVEALGETTGAAVHADFVKGYADLRGQLRAPPGYEHPPYAARRAAIERWQRGVVEAGHEIKQWSRQSLLAVALENHGVPVTEALIRRVVDEAYWGTIRDHSEPIPEAAEVIAALRASGVLLHAATNSDGFLHFDEAAQTHRYDPAHAVAEKHRRLTSLRALGFAPEDISVGDPIGKPDARFFDAVLARFGARIGQPVDLARTLAVGDSLGSDVMPIVSRGGAYGAWILPKDPVTSPAWLEVSEPAHRRVVKIQRLSQLSDVDWPTTGGASDA